MQASFEDKKRKLIRILKNFDRLAVALSGGVDSAVLLTEAHDVLGDRLIAVTARSPIHPEKDIADAAKVCADLGVTHRIVDSNELRLADFIANTPERCYICKKNVFGQLLARIREEGIPHLIHGANADDLNDYRPGLRAASELGVTAPLMEAGLTKQEIRLLAKARGVSVWNKPAMACIATRIPYGSPITPESIEQIKQAETMLGSVGLSGYRVRHHGTIARIEAPLEQLTALVGDPLRQQVVDQLRTIGFDHICLDLEGYVAGSMNRRLDPGA